MKRHFLVLILLGGFLLMGLEARAQISGVVPPTDRIFDSDVVFKNINVTDYTGAIDQRTPNPDSFENPGSFYLRNLFTTIVRFVERIMMPIAVGYLLWAGITLVIHRNDEELFNKKASQIIWVGIGFGLMAASFTLVDKMFFGTKGQIISEENTNGFALLARLEIDGLVNFLSAFAAAIAVLFLVMSAIRIIVAGGNEEETKKARDSVLYSVIGLTLIMMMYTIVNFFFGFNQDGKLLGIDLSSMNIEVTAWVNILLGFVAFLAVISIIYAGIQMVINFGDEEAVNKSKQILIMSVAGLVLSMSAWSIVRFLIAPGI